jgi:hypothetical protein
VQSAKCKMKKRNNEGGLGLRQGIRSRFQGPQCRKPMGPGSQTLHFEFCTLNFELSSAIEIPRATENNVEAI